ncbi:hypothetical protein OS493_002466 [Desmophyllum pertusum]|uniref:Uncharacterized protein n=1 Tax=Desmophyllum pertusum TaxID=174260 RepID=A0A9W9YT03_9CNID|nr:hypothetical protein OS493_002466 [Desmophyllum pertusum]
MAFLSTILPLSPTRKIWRIYFNAVIGWSTSGSKTRTASGGRQVVGEAKVKFVYPGVVYHPAKTIFDIIEDEGIEVLEELKYSKYRTTFDIEVIWMAIFRSKILTRTLLGAYRTGDIMSHDHDADISFILSTESLDAYLGLRKMGIR